MGVLAVELTSLFQAELAQRRKASMAVVVLLLRLVAVAVQVKLAETQRLQQRVMEETELPLPLQELAWLALAVAVVVTTLTLVALCQALELVVLAVVATLAKDFQTLKAAQPTQAVAVEACRLPLRLSLAVTADQVLSSFAIQFRA